jgi:hypothetical protein
MAAWESWEPQSQRRQRPLLVRLLLVLLVRVLLVLLGDSHVLCDGHNTCCHPVPYECL